VTSRLHSLVFQSCCLASIRSLLTTGWLAKIRLSQPNDFEALLSAEAYKAHCEGQSEDH